MRALAVIGAMLVAVGCLVGGGRGAEPAGELTKEERQRLENQAEALAKAASDLDRAGRLTDAIEKAQQRVDVVRRLYPKRDYPSGHSDLVASISYLASLLQDQGEMKKAEALHREVLEMCRELYPKEKYPQGHQQLTASLQNLWRSLQFQGRYAEAEPLVREALVLDRARYPKEDYPQGHADLVSRLLSLAEMLRIQGQYRKAESVGREALEMARALYPKEKYPQGHEQLALALNDLAVVLQAQRELGKAEPVSREALEMLRALYPREKYPRGHSSLLVSMNNFAGLLLSQGKSAEAETLFRECFTMSHALYPKDEYPQGHPYLIGAINKLGSLLYRKQEFEKAEPLFREALDIDRMIYPKEKYPQGHPDLALSLENLVRVFQAQRQPSKAEPFAREVLAMNRALYPRERYPQGHTRLAASLYNLGYVLHAQREYTKAEPLYREALEMRRALYPKEKYPQGHPDLVLTLNHLADLLSSEGEYAKAEPLSREAVEMARAVASKDKSAQANYDLASNINNLAALLLRRGEAKKAEAIYREALGLWRDLYPRDNYPRGHPALIVALNGVASALRAQGENAKSEPLLREALDMSRALFPKTIYPQGSHQLLLSIHNLAACLTEQENYKQAEPLQREALEICRALFPKDRYPDGYPDLARGIRNLAVLLDYQGEHAKADPLYREALEMNTAMAQRVAATAPEPVALNFAVSLAPTRDWLLANALQLSDSDSNTYEAIWSSKAAITRVYQRRHLALTAAAADKLIKQEYDQLVLLRNEREQLIMAPRGNDAQARGEALAKLNSAIGKAEQALLPRLASLEFAERLARKKPADLQKLLPSDAVLIDIVRYVPPRSPAPSYAAFVLTGKEIKRVELGVARDIDQSILAWREAVTLAVPADNEKARKENELKTAERAAKLRKVVWEPIQKFLPSTARTVYVAPDGDLTQLPWGALPGSARGSVLLDDYALAIVPHAPFVLERLSPPPDRPKARKPAEGLLLVGGVRYEAKPEAVVAGETQVRGDPVLGKRLEWAYLKGSEQERKWIANVAETAKQKCKTLEGKEAGVEQVCRQLPQAQFAHIATHGFFADKSVRSVLQLDKTLFDRVEHFDGTIGQRIGEGARNPLVLSGLVLAGANREDAPERGILSADAIAGLLLDDLHLAVLSACDTGLGDVAGGEGVYGLQRAFHIAGAKNVVASLWKVDDAATAALMVLFYRKLWEEKKPPIEALREAQLSIYRNPDLIPKWAAGERAPNVKGVRPPTGEVKPTAEPVATDGTAPVRLWAAFTLSGLGR